MIIEDEIKRILNLIHAHSPVIEIRIPKANKYGGTYSGYYDNVNAAAQDILRYNGKVPSVYITLNRIQPALLARAINRMDENAKLTTTDADVVGREWLYLDIDPLRPAGISSTEEEHNAAIAKAYHIRDEMLAYGWPEPVISDSGNGASLLYKIKMENSKQALETVKNVLNAMDYFFSDEKIQIDQSVFNAARIIKVYGTKARKGDSTEERPHRDSVILELPVDIQELTPDLIQAFLDVVPKEPDPSKETAKNSSGFDIQNWLKTYDIHIQHTKPWNGGMVYCLEECPFDPNHKAPDSSIIQHKSGAVSFHCFHNSCFGHTWKELRAMKEPNRKTKKEVVPKARLDVQSLGDSDPIYTDMRNSKRLASIVGDNARFCSGTDIWMVHNGKIWEGDTNGAMMRWAREVTRELQRNAVNIDNLDARKDAMSNALKCESFSRLKAMVELCKSEEGMSIDANAFDKNKMLFNVQNGTLDLLTGKLLPHNPLDFITKISPVVYDPNATCPRFLRFLDEALLFGDDGLEMTERISHTKNIIAYLKRHSGYCLTGITKEEQFLILYGDGGHGKSKYIGAIAHVMGTYHDKVDMATIQESSRSKDGSSPTPDIVKLKGLRFITTSEPEKGLRLNESRIKDFTGRDPITGRGLHQSPITYMPEFKIGIYTNYPIIIRGQDKSMWRRVHQAGFDCEPKCIDMDLNLKLQSEASGILNWMLAGCLEWNQTGLAVPKEITDAVEDYKNEMDVMSGFFELCCVCDKKDQNMKELGKALFHVYQAWWQVDNNSYAPYFDKQFYQLLHERGFKRVEKHSKNGLIIKGVKLNEDVKKSYDEAIALCSGSNSEAVKMVTRFLVNFIPTPHTEKNTEKSSPPSPPSPPSPNEERHEAAKETSGDFKGDGVTEVTEFPVNSIAIPHVYKKPDISVTSVTPSPNEASDIATEKNKEASPPIELVSTLTHQIRTYGDFWQKHHGVINTVTRTQFCKDFKDTNRPKNDRSYMYTVSDLEQIVSRVFKLTPAAENGTPVTPVGKPLQKTEAPTVTPPAGGIYGMTCGVCNTPLNGAYEFMGIKLGNVHLKCKELRAKVGQ
jgi:P4 family phage/plasmid primase-like protien